MSRLQAASLIVASITLACQGVIGDTLDAGGESGTGPFPGTALTLTKTRVWPLTAEQYERTVEAAFEMDIDVTKIRPTARTDEFLNAIGGLEMNEVYFAGLEETALAFVSANAQQLETRLSCAIASLNASCLTAYLERVGRRLLRTSHADYSPYVAQFQQLRTEIGAKEAFQAVVAALLMSPRLLYRTELGSHPATPVGEVVLTPDEIAQSLAYTLWNGPPDDELLDLAESGELSDASVVEAQVLRLQDAPAGYRGMTEYLLQWLGLATFHAVTKNPNVFPEFDATLREAMLGETTQYIDYVLRDRGGRLTDLISSEESIVTPAVSAIYGIPEGTGLTRLPEERRGVFTQPAVIAAISGSSTTDAMYRGKFLLTKLFCMTLVRPPNVVVELEDLPKSATTRQQFEAVEHLDGCASCHVMLNPPAFAMERFDGIGRYRTEENGKTIDTSGALAFTTHANAPYGDAAEMLDLVAASPDVQACFVRQSFRYVTGREETSGDDPVLRSVFETFAADPDMRRLFRDLLLSPSFMKRGWRT